MTVRVHAASEKSMNTSNLYAPITRRAAVGALWGVAAGMADAQEKPGGLARKTLVVPNSVGSSLDATARKITELADQRFDEVSLVQNLPGAGGIIAVHSFLRSPKDGSTILVANSGLVCNTPVLSPERVKFDPEVDLVPICTLATIDSVVVVGSGFPANHLKEFQETSARATAPVFYAISNTGNSHHIGGELLFKTLGISAAAVPYRDNARAILDVSEGRVALGIFSLPAVSSLLAAGKLKALTLLSDQRLEAAPTIPTVREQGFPGFDVKGWIALFYASGVPAELVIRYESQMSTLFHQHKLSTFISDIGLNPRFLGHKQSRHFVNSEIQKYRKILTEINLKIA